MRFKDRILLINFDEPSDFSIVALVYFIFLLLCQLVLRAHDQSPQKLTVVYHSEKKKEKYVSIARKWLCI